MSIRVLRLLEYTYSDVETMVADMARWQVGANGSHQAGTKVKISSTTLPPSIFEDES